jgi:flagellar hook assembly protein FlgD
MLPKGFELAQNYPNPFNPTTTINFSLPAASDARLDIYNVIGERVTTLINEFLPAGRYQITWNGRLTDGAQAPSALYLYRLEAGDFSQTRKMLLVK